MTKTIQPFGRLRRIVDAFVPGNVIRAQKALCKEYGSPWVASPDELRVGIARNALKSDLRPLNGERSQIVPGNMTGWYIWAGEELSKDPDYFEAVCVSHLAELCPMALRFLGLAPGWRFLTTETYIDVWEEPSILLSNDDDVVER